MNGYVSRICFTCVLIVGCTCGCLLACMLVGFLFQIHLHSVIMWRKTCHLAKQKLHSWWRLVTRVVSTLPRDVVATPVWTPCVVGCYSHMVRNIQTHMSDLITILTQIPMGLQFVWWFQSSCHDMMSICGVCNSVNHVYILINGWSWCTWLNVSSSSCDRVFHHVNCLFLWGIYLYVHVGIQPCTWPRTLAARWCGGTSRKTVRVAV